MCDNANVSGPRVSLAADKLTTNNHLSERRHNKMMRMFTLHMYNMSHCPIVTVGSTNRYQPRFGSRKR